MSTLSTDAILQGMADALPTHKKGDDGSDLSSSYEVIALVVHSYLAALGFKLYGFNEDKHLPEAEQLAPRLPPQWNDGFGSISFVYKHKQSSLTFVVRIDRMGAKVEVRGLAVDDENIHRFEVNVRDVVTSSALPLRITLTEEGEEGRQDLVEKLRKLFVSEEVISKILRDLKVNIVQKLIPKLQKEDYVEEIEAEANARAERRQMEAEQNPYGRRGPQPAPVAPHPHPGLLPDMARPRPVVPQGEFAPPGFEDEYEVNRPPIGGLPGRTPYGIGHDDLYPPGLGPHDPLRPSIGGGGGLPRPGGGSGMHPTLEDIMRSDHPGSGRGGYDPQAPPGARWDPTGPSGSPRYPGPGSGSGNYPFGGGGSGYGFGPGGGGII